jgi:hypothetical protein
MSFRTDPPDGAGGAGGGHGPPTPRSGTSLSGVSTPRTVNSVITWELQQFLENGGGKPPARPSGNSPRISPHSGGGASVGRTFYIAEVEDGGGKRPAHTFTPVSRSGIYLAGGGASVGSDGGGKQPARFGASTPDSRSSISLSGGGASVGSALFAELQQVLQERGGMVDAQDGKPMSNYVDELGNSPSHLRYTILENDKTRRVVAALNNEGGSIVEDISAFGGDSISAVGHGAWPLEEEHRDIARDNSVFGRDSISAVGDGAMPTPSEHRATPSTFGLAQSFMQESISSFAQSIAQSMMSTTTGRAQMGSSENDGQFRFELPNAWQEEAGAAYELPRALEEEAGAAYDDMAEEDFEDAMED